MKNSIKKNHHIIPKVYLKEFLDFEKPKNFPTDKPFNPFIWKIDKFLKLNPVPRSPEKSFGKNKFYKLDSDSDEHQIIEELLGRIENAYNNSLQRLKDKNPLSDQELVNLIIFIETLHQRTETQVEHWQSQFNKIEELYRMVDQSHNNNQNHSDDFWKGSHEIGKKLIISGTGSRAKLLLEAGVYFLFNNSEMSFVSSDNPVIWTLKHIDELQNFGIPDALIRTEIGKNQKNWFCFCALTPVVALISSPFLKRMSEKMYQYLNIHDEHFVIWMNLLSHISSASVIVSNKANPYGHYKDNMKKNLAAVSSLQKIKGKQILFYTSKLRYLLNVEEYKHTHEGLASRIEFVTKDLETLRLLAKDNVIESVHLYIDGDERGFSRNLKFLEVSSNEEKPSKLIQIL